MFIFVPIIPLIIFTELTEPEHKRTVKVERVTKLFPLPQNHMFFPITHISESKTPFII